ncbi:MAG: isoprenylcysteine carboxylmethyltransferase family protein [Candidatus Cloacimonadales bacterium]|nr:isoprenylcysteine carboxylmethyltransferase family protein [Candidatus Cloacimonadales bacterium]
MALKEEIRDQGNWLFQHRSYLPILLLPLVIIGLLTERITFLNSYYINIYNWVCIIISILGFAVRIITIGQVPKSTSGRNTKKQIAKTLNETGIYSVVRHPLYLGNFLMWLGIILFVRSIWVAIVFVLLYWIYYERIMYAEEAFPTEKFGQDYTEWASKTPPFWPSWKKWQKSKLDFSIKNVLKREYSGFFGLVVSFVFIANLDLIYSAGKFTYNRISLIILAISFVIYLILRSMKKFTRVLHEKGR